MLKTKNEIIKIVGLIVKIQMKNLFPYAIKISATDDDHLDCKEKKACGIRRRRYETKTARKIGYGKEF